MNKRAIINNKSTSHDEKIAWEKQAIMVFIDWFNHNFAQNLVFMSHNQPAKPDVSCRLDDNRIDIEIAHLYGTEQEAMSILGKSLDRQTQKELVKLKRTSSAEQRLVSALNRILEQKAHKYYESSLTWLVIRNVHPGWNTDKIQSARKDIVIPDQHPFSQIWVIGDETAEPGAVRIFSAQNEIDDDG